MSDLSAFCSKILPKNLPPKILVKKIVKVLGFWRYFTEKSIAICNTFLDKYCQYVGGTPRSIANSIAVLRLLQ